jgi:hypothetical protein
MKEVPPARLSRWIASVIYTLLSLYPLLDRGGGEEEETAMELRQFQLHYIL